MNRKNNPKNYKACCIIAIILISFFVTSCASNHTANTLEDTKHSATQAVVPPEKAEQYRDNQKKWLSGLHEGMSTEEALRQVYSYCKYSFQYKTNGRLFQYFEGEYPITEIGFGLLFENGRLTNLLLDKAVWEFSWYRYNYARVRGHLFQYWLPNGFPEGVSMIRQNNRLGDNYDDVNSAYQQQDVNNNGGAADVSEAVITSLFFAPFLPIALVAMPFVPEEDTTEQHERITKTHEDTLRKLANELELGVTTTTELQQLLGAPKYRGGTMWTYPNIKFGITNGIVVWGESWPNTELQ